MTEPTSTQEKRKTPSRENVRLAVQFALICIASYLIGYYFTLIISGATASLGGMWAAISAILVFQVTNEETWTAALLRVRGTLIGAIIAAVYLSFLPFSPIGAAVCVGVGVLVCLALGLPGGIRLAAITVLIIMVISSANPGISPVENATLRFFESCIGAGIAVVVAWLWRTGASAV